MFKALTAASNLLRTVAALGTLALLAVVGWIGWNVYYAPRQELRQARATLAEKEVLIEDLTRDVENGSRRIAGLNVELTASKRENDQLVREVTRKTAQIDVLNKDLEAKRKEIQHLETAVRLLKVDHRVARIAVLSQRGSAETSDLITKFSFVEVDDQANPLEKPRVFTIEGDVIYVDAWVIKFTDELVTLPDPVRFTSLCQFRRIFGEMQRPSEGFVLDAVGALPAPYRGARKMSELEQRIWTRFWQYANDPVKARKDGVRAVHGEAPSIRLMAGKTYKVLLRASDGLTIVTEEGPLSRDGNLL